MSLIYGLVNRLDDALPISVASAHCDIPCKIYDPHTAQIAVLTMIRTLDIMAELPQSGELTRSQQAEFTRLVAQKEQHGIEVKEAVRVIWGDYFKQPQLEQFPEIHSLTHEIMMVASRAKQNLDRDAALTLLEKVNRFADIFWQSKGVATYTADCPYPPALPVVYPDLKS